MPVYADPSELREGTRLPANVARQCKPLNGLERVTGADLLVTPNDLGVDDVANLAGIDPRFISRNEPQITARNWQRPLPIVLSALRLWDACQNGLLVQRKTGQDIAASVPKYSEIKARMLLWCRSPWLLLVGDVKVNSSNMLIVDGRERKLHHNAYQGALEVWQEYRRYIHPDGMSVEGSGGITILSRDSLVVSWIARQMDKVQSQREESEIFAPHVPPVRRDDYPWLATLLSLPGCGVKKARAIAEIGKTLAGCIEWITGPDWANSRSTSRPKNVTRRDILVWREWFALNEERLQMIVCWPPDGMVASPKFSEKGEDDGK